MALGKRDLVTLDDLPGGTLKGLLALAREIHDHRGALPGGLDGGAAGRILAALFMEPSTRTRLSFETAMLRLGGRVIGAADPGGTSAAKGESLRDMVRVVGGFADVLVLRHPAEGAARVAADCAGVPVLNAGDGGHAHPSQTLCDLLALEVECGRLRDLTLLVTGDLLHGRTVHSLLPALARFGARMALLPEPGLGLPVPFTARIMEEHGYRMRPMRFPGLEDLPDTGLLEPSRQEAPPAGGEAFVPGEGAFDALYVTRVQVERRPGRATLRRLPVVDRHFLATPCLNRARVLHPLPRVGEIAPGLDTDPRAAYFRQAALGVPARMALLAWSLGEVDLESPRPASWDPVPPGLRCPRPTCVSVLDPEAAPAGMREAGGERLCSWCQAVLEGP